jgi:1,2-dihydroxy-3-keto-5-methylthiopentene dioxygenase
MDDERTAEQRANDEKQIRERDQKRRAEEDERKQKAEEERRAEEKKQQAAETRRVEDERRRKKQEEEWKRMGSDKILSLPPVPSSFTDDSNQQAMKVWMLDDETSKAPLRQLSLKPGRKQNAPSVSLQQLKELGLVYFKINLNDFSLINQIVKERAYKHTDEIRVSQTCKDEMFIDKWFTEHFCDDEQLRLVTDGSCYFDIRTRQDTWVRLHLSAGDLICMPAGLYHRAALDEDDYCAIMRLFCDSQRWSPTFRSEKKADNHPSRLSYLRMLKKGNVAVEMGYK